VRNMRGSGAIPAKRREGAAPKTDSLRGARRTNNAASTVDAPAAGDDVVSALGQRVKALRTEAGLTLEQLAQRSGVSRAMLSKVERGEKSPTLSVISRTAVGLNVSLSSLLGAEPDPAEFAVVRRDQRLVYRDPETGFDRELLSPTHIGNGVELLLHRIPPGASSGELPSYPTPTEKYLVVETGRLVVTIGGLRQVLEVGDALYFDVKQPYRFDNEGDEPVAYYVVIVRRRLVQ
jgi:transcriptional regulator with XRE-family HTH domain